ncbi:MAG: CoA transferase, partial [Mycobacterium sp.]|nr:CoA transferase [Mycobacterium sp.]
LRRRDQHDAIDKYLSAWCETRSADAIVSCLWSAGVPVAKVMQPHRQTEIPQLAARGFFEDIGGVRHSTLPFTRPGPVHLRPAPKLGQHNHEVLTELQYTDGQIAALEAGGVIGHAPAGG